MSEYDAIAIVAFCVGVLFGISWGWKLGKRTAFSIIRSHIDSGRSPELALEYEEAVNEGRIPRG